MLDGEDGVWLEMERAAGAAVLDVDRPAGWARVALRCRRRPAEDLMLHDHPEKLGLRARLLHRDQEVGDEERVFELSQLAVGLDGQAEPFALHDELGTLGREHVDHMLAALVVDELASLGLRTCEIAAVIEQLEPAPEVVRAPAREEAIDMCALHDLVHADRADDLVVTLLELKWPGLRAAKARQALLDAHPSSIHHLTATRRPCARLAPRALVHSVSPLRSSERRVKLGAL